jgi:hypothetical protein
VTLTASLPRDPIVVAGGSYRFGTRQSTEMRPFLTAYGLAQATGGLVVEVVKGSSAEVAGLLAGDVIVRFANRAVGSSAELTAIIDATASGVSTPIEVIRVGQGPDDLSAHLGTRAMRGDREAITAQAELAYNGFRGRTDYPEALRLYRTAADLGDGLAALRLGSMYVAGLGTSVDLVSASSWFLSAADAGMAEANHNLGMLYWTGRYWNGRIIIGDDTEAVRQFRKAADASVSASYF